MNCAGIGKTTLANEICLRWARDGFLSEDFDAIILIPLRCVQQRSLEEVMIEYTEEKVYRQLNKSVGSRCLIILEGLDEMAIDNQLNDRFLFRLINCTILEEATIMITSRPHACEEINADRYVEVVGFGVDQIKEFIKKSFPNDEHSVSELLQQLNDYPHLKSMCYVPLNLVMIIDIFKCRQKKLPSTLTELYKLFIVMTLVRQNMKESEKYIPSDASMVVEKCKILKTMLPGIPINVIGIFILLCRLSFCGFFNWHVYMKEKYRGGKKKLKYPKVTFTIEDLKQCGIEVTSQFDGFGLLKATHIHDVPADTSIYSFSHLSVQEFLSSLYISLLPQEEQLCLVNQYFHDFPDVFIFLAGLTRLKCNEMYQLIYSRLIVCYDVLYAVRCMYEGNCHEQSALPFTLDISDDNRVVPYDCYCISYMISHYSVSKLKMQHCYMDDTRIEILAKYYSNESTTAQFLELLEVGKNELTAVGMVHIMKIVRSELHYQLCSYTE